MSLERKYFDLKTVQLLKIKTLILSLKSSRLAIHSYFLSSSSLV